MSKFILRKIKNKVVVFIPNGMTGEEVTRLFIEHEDTIKRIKYDMLVRRIMTEEVIHINNIKDGSNTI